MTKEEKIKYANRELIELGNLDIIADTFVNDYISHSAGKDYEGHNFIKRWVKNLRTAISEICLVKVEFHIQTSNTIVWQRTLSGKHTTKMWGIRASEQKIKWTEMVVSRFDDNKISEEWIVSDLVGQLLSKAPKN